MYRYVNIALLFISLLFIFTCINDQNNFLGKNSNDTHSAKPQEDSEKPTDKTEEIPGYLTCQPTTAENDISQYSCVFRNSEGTKYPGELSEWKISIIPAQGDPTEITSFTKESSESPWHITFTVPADLKDGRFVIRVSVKIGDKTYDDVVACPVGYIKVPGDPVYQASSFCVMKYEARINKKDHLPLSTFEGLPDYGKKTFTEAVSACESIGAGYSLITNNEWMTIGINIIKVADNWGFGDGSIGSGTLNRGATNESSPLEAFAEDKQTTWDINKRTHKLVNNEIIWDFSGNVSEYVNIEFLITDKPKPYGNKMMEFIEVIASEQISMSMLVPTKANYDFWDDSWNTSFHGIGRIYLGGEATMNIAVVRGGSWKGGVSTGIFTVDLNSNGAYANNEAGYRCVYHP